IYLKGTMPGVNDPKKSSVFWEIKDRCFEFAFPKKHIEIYKLTQNNQQLEQDYNILQVEKNQLELDKITLQTENKKIEQDKNKLENQILELQKKLEEKNQI
ncbi:hypothetical protein ACFTY7_47260, partial [Streptomyces sp. NPDC057062]|uniref:hypothetical protein n=1 Tax=Streptomyces sp. NPDC057062 TaxID=3346011 RepID=UPI00363320F8